MPGIIEKLGMKNYKKTSYVNLDIISELQTQRDEMIEALIDNTLLIEDAWQALPSGEQDEIQYFENINIIQKATGKSWEEIKELL